MRKQWKQWQTLFWGAPKLLQMVSATMKLKMFAPWKKAMTHLDSILKSRDITLPTKVYIVKATVFPVVMYRRELVHKQGWARKNWCFRTVIWRRLLRVPWTSRRSNQSILNEIKPEYSLEGLRMKLQYSGYLMWRTDSLDKMLMLGKVEGRRRRGQ